LNLTSQKMAVMHFSEEMNEWYRIMVHRNQPLPWELLVEEVSARFKLATIKHPVDEFKRLHQVGTVEEYIKKFCRVNARLLYYDSNLKDEFFIQGFISGLRDEIKHLVEVLSLRKLNDAFHHAYKFELSLKSQQKKI
jgi:Retrotransposon gag protein